MQKPTCNASWVSALQKKQTGNCPPHVCGGPYSCFCEEKGTNVNKNPWEEGRRSRGGGIGKRALGNTNTARKNVKYNRKSTSIIGGCKI